MVMDAIRGEYRRYRSLGEGALAQLGDEDLYRVLGEDGNSIAVLIRHLGGNLRSRFTDFLASDGEKPWRDRDGEFLQPDQDRQALMDDWQRGWQVLETSLADLDDSRLAQEIVIRGQTLTVIEALQRSLAHVAYHVGQIVLLARWQKGKAWKSLSIPRGDSAQYNSNPNRERPPA